MVRARQSALAVARAPWAPRARRQPPAVRPAVHRRARRGTRCCTRPGRSPAKCPTVSRAACVLPYPVGGDAVEPRAPRQAVPPGRRRRFPLSCPTASIIIGARPGLGWDPAAPALRRRAGRARAAHWQGGSTMPTAPRPGLLAIVAALMLAGCAAPTAPGAAAPAPRVPVKAIYVAMGMNSAPFWLAKDAGFFDQQGLDVELTYVAGAVTPAQSLTAGEAYFSSGGAASVTPARLAGADLILLGSQVDIYQFQVFARPEIQRP